MPKLKSYDTDSFNFPIKDKTIKFANVKGQKTYIKNRMDRIMSKEPETIKWINSFTKDSVFFDVGANIGIYTLYSAVMRENTVYSFEPHVKNMHEGVADNKVGQRGNYYHGCTEMHLDYLVGKGILPQPTHIKIDVDGFEDRVIKGSYATIQKCKSVLIEIDNKHIEFVQKIKDLGLTLQSQHKRNEEEFNYIFSND